jgi:molybdate transport system substrate-binding protein
MNRARRMLRRQRQFLHAWMAVMTLCAIGGCGGSRQGSGGGSAGSPLRIAAASDLQSAFPVLAERFRASGGVAITPAFQSSGVLARQIEQGAPYDLFFAANEAFVRNLAVRSTIRPESVRIYARGSLVLVVHNEVAGQVKSLADLARPEIKRIAIANPETAPYGKAGKQALDRSGLWESLRPRIVIAESVRQALLHAQNGDAEAALVGRAISDVPEVRSIAIEPALYDPIVQALGIIADSSRPSEAEAFATFVLGPEGQGILKTFGFQPGPAEAAPAPSEASPRHRESVGKGIE